MVVYRSILPININANEVTNFQLNPLATLFSASLNQRPPLRRVGGKAQYCPTEWMSRNWEKVMDVSLLNNVALIEDSNSIAEVSDHSHVAGN